MGRYLRLLEWSLRNPFVMLALGALIFVGSIVIAGSLPYGFLPTNDLSRSVLLIELPPGSTDRGYRGDRGPYYCKAQGAARSQERLCGRRCRRYQRAERHRR